ncbi:MAG: hypothetical protein Alpg2KO_29990 [Alphaproteobacteria bacterium]
MIRLPSNSANAGFAKQIGVALHQNHFKNVDDGIKSIFAEILQQHQTGNASIDDVIYKIKTASNHIKDALDHTGKFGPIALINADLVGTKDGNVDVFNDIVDALKRNPTVEEQARWAVKDGLKIGFEPGSAYNAGSGTPKTAIGAGEARTADGDFGYDKRVGWLKATQDMVTNNLTEVQLQQLVGNDPNLRASVVNSITLQAEAIGDDVWRGLFGGTPPGDFGKGTQETDSVRNAVRELEIEKLGSPALGQGDLDAINDLADRIRLDVGNDASLDDIRNAHETLTGGKGLSKLITGFILEDGGFIRLRKADAELFNHLVNRAATAMDLPAHEVEARFNAWKFGVPDPEMEHLFNNMKGVYARLTETAAGSRGVTESVNAFAQATGRSSAAVLGATKNWIDKVTAPGGDLHGKLHLAGQALPEGIFGHLIGTVIMGGIDASTGKDFDQALIDAFTDDAALTELIAEVAIRGALAVAGVSIGLVGGIVLGVAIWAANELVGADLRALMFDQGKFQFGTNGRDTFNIEVGAYDDWYIHGGNVRKQAIDALQNTSDPDVQAIADLVLNAIQGSTGGSGGIPEVDLTEAQQEALNELMIEVLRGVGGNVFNLADGRDVLTFSNVTKGIVHIITTPTSFRIEQVGERDLTFSDAVWSRSIEEVHGADTNDRFDIYAEGYTFRGKGGDDQFDVIGGGRHSSSRNNDLRLYGDAGNDIMEFDWQHSFNTGGSNDIYFNGGSGGDSAIITTDDLVGYRFDVSRQGTALGAEIELVGRPGEVNLENIELLKLDHRNDIFWDNDIVQFGAEGTGAVVQVLKNSQFVVSVATQNGNSHLTGQKYPNLLRIDQSYGQGPVTVSVGNLSALPFDIEIDAKGGAAYLGAYSCDGGGIDIMDGGTGRDWISAGLGTDTLTGGGDADLFALHTGDGIDQITDFDLAEEDQLDLTGLAGLTDLAQLVWSLLDADADGQTDDSRLMLNGDGFDLLDFDHTSTALGLDNILI